MRDYRRHIGRQIRQAREREGLTQSELARRLGISFQLLQRHEAGEKLHLDRMIMIAEILRIDLSILITGQAPARRGRKVLEIGTMVAAAGLAVLFAARECCFDDWINWLAVQIM